MTTASDSNASSDDEEEENALETTGYRKRKGKGTKDVRSRKKVAGLDRPQHVGQGRLTVSCRSGYRSGSCSLSNRKLLTPIPCQLKPVALGIFSKGKASARAKTGAHHHRESFFALLSRGSQRNLELTPVSSFRACL